ncbi:MAG: hypothetical protein CMD85_02685 [Gammaproteobacteria bacterium]|nr:hypothetical protein [Gammaproteobacteria bacterium]|tara:strand:+ start:2827 stop:3828 length:1002 start_codon:yes stop_codon:yes gene_type:complete
MKLNDMKFWLLFILASHFFLSNTISAEVSWNPSKTWFGDPNLQGTWTNATLTTLERPDSIDQLEISDRQANSIVKAYQEGWDSYDNQLDVGEEIKEAGDPGGYNTAWMDPGNKLLKINGKYRSSVIVYPEDGKLPRKWVRWGREGINIYRMFAVANHPEQRSLGERCLVGFGSSGGPPMLNVLYNNNYQIVQSPGYVMILVEMNHDARIIRLDSEHRPDNIKPWLGDSVGYWEGNTLVVKTKNHHPQQKFRAAIRHQILISEGAIVTERFTRTSNNEILYEFTVDDDSAYKDIWKGEIALRKSNDQIYEYACHEGNYAMANILAGARAEEEGD